MSRAQLRQEVESWGTGCRKTKVTFGLRHDYPSIASEPGQHRTLELGLDELADFFRVISLDQLGHPRLVLVLRAHGQQVDVRRLGGFQGNRVLGAHAGGQRKVGVDGRGIEVIALDASMAQAADYQIGLAYLKEKKFKEAKDVFKDVVVLDPNSNLADFSNEYVKAIKRKEEKGN